MSRSTTFTKEQADSICEHIASGKSLVSWCNEEDRPHYATVMRWMQAEPAFRERYACAREAQADFLAEQVIQISDDGGNDTYVDKEGRTRTDTDVIARSKLRVDARKWYASKLAPKKYGDKLEIEQRTTVTDLTEEQLDARLAALRQAESDALNAPQG